MQALDEAFSEFVEEGHDVGLRVIFDTDSYSREIGDVKQSDLVDSFVQVDGMIRLCEDLVTKIDSAVFECSQCGTRYEKEQDSGKLKSPYKCECGSKKFQVIEKRFKDFLKFELASNDVQDDSLFCRAELKHLFDGYREALQTGRRVRVSGYVSKEKLSKKSEEYRTVFNVIGYQSLDKKTDFSQIDDKVKREVKRKVEESENPFRDFALSIAPEIREMELPKKQVGASLIGATPFEDKREWGRIHSCFYSNPGMGKSALMEEVNDVFGNVHTADNNSSGVGLTGTVTETKDNRWRVTAGTMVFADKGVLTIDEFDKIDSEDLGSLNTAMESGYIQINKAARAKLPARASVIVAGNFEKTLDKYDEVQEHLPEKAVGLSDRFALMSAITEQDTEKVSNAIMDKYADKDSGSGSVRFTEEELVVYRNITQRFYPKLSREARERLMDYIKAEKDVAESKDNTEFQGESNRFIEDLAKLTMMFARSRFSSRTSKEDAERAYQLFRECRDTLGSDVGEPGVKASQRQRFAEVKEKYDLVKGDDGKAEVEEIIEKVDLEEDKAEEVIEKLKREGELFEPSQGEVQEI
jgi:replicative DNA helicase Mcm